MFILIYTCIYYVYYIIVALTCYVKRKWAQNLIYANDRMKGDKFAAAHTRVQFSTYYTITTVTNILRRLAFRTFDLLRFVSVHTPTVYLPIQLSNLSTIIVTRLHTHRHARVASNYIPSWLHCANYVAAADYHSTLAVYTHTLDRMYVY